MLPWQWGDELHPRLRPRSAPNVLCGKHSVSFIPASFLNVLKDGAASLPELSGRYIVLQRKKRRPGSSVHAGEEINVPHEAFRLAAIG
jgi:hypothetical protein